MKINLTPDQILDITSILYTWADYIKQIDPEEAQKVTDLKDYILSEYVKH